MAISRMNLSKWMKLGRARRPKQFIPRIGPESNHGRESGLNITKLYSA